MSWLRYLLVFCCVLATPLAPAQEKSSVRSLSIGILPYLSTRTLLANYQPIAVQLERELKQPVQLLTAPDFETFVKRVIDGEYDIAILAPHYARLAVKQFGYSTLLVNKTPIRGILVTARNKPLTDINELRGQTIAVVDRSALIAIVGAMTLADEGLKEGNDYTFVQTVSHSSALHNVISGKSRAALISYSTLALAPPELQHQALIARELAVIPGLYYIANNRLSAARQQAIKVALLAFQKAPEGQQFFEKTQTGGYRETNREDGELLDRLLPETRRQLGKLLN
jgi:phosphonate transport system substrate-binding protein